MVHNHQLNSSVDVQFPRVTIDEDLQYTVHHF